MTQPGDNRKDDLEEYIAGDSSLSRTYRRQAKEQPSNAVDDAVRAAARREVASGPRHIINPFGRHWAVPASLAAVFLLSVGLVMFLSDETGLSNLQNDVLEESVTGRQMAPSVGAASVDDSAAPGPTTGTAGGLQRKRQIKKQPASLMQPVDSQKRVETGRPELTKQKTRARQDTPGLTSDKARPKKPEAKVSDVPEPALRMEMDAPAESTKLTPELWLQNIENLRRQGKPKEADAGLAQFRKAYPNYPLDSLYK